MEEKIRLSINEEMKCPGCDSSRMHTIDIFTNSQVNSYIACSSCEEMHKVPINSDMQRIVDKIIKIMDGE